MLQAVARAYARPSPLGVATTAVIEELRDADATATGLILDELVRAGYLEQTADTDSSIGPLYSRLTEKGLRRTAGWPSESAGEVALERLLERIDERIAEAATEEEQTRWQRLRDAVVEVGHDVFVDVLGKILTGGI